MSWVEEVIPETLTVEHGGQQIPAREHEFFKTAPDKETFLKNAYEAHREIGRRIPLPNGQSKPEDIEKWKQTHLPKLQEAGLVPKPQSLPDKYEIKLPEGLPAEAWKDEDTKLATEYAKKHGLSQEALNDGLGIVTGILGKFGASVQVNREAQLAKIQEWAKSENIPLEEVQSALDRFNKDPRGWDTETAEAVSKSGFADNPLVVKAIYTLMKDSGMFDTRGDTGAQKTTGGADDDWQEARKIRFDAAHPLHADYMKEGSVGPLHDRVDAAYKKKFGAGEV